MRSAAIILSAGKGQRMGSETPKQYMELAGKPLLSYSIKAFEASRVDEILIVAGAEDLAMIKEDIVARFGFSKVCDVIAGGSERYFSVLFGLRYFAETNVNKVLIHDGARPFLPVSVIHEMLDAMSDEEAVIAGMPVKDTIKLADDQDRICGTTDRRLTWMAQTPQAFCFAKILAAYETLVGPHVQSGADPGELACVTDDAMVFSAVWPDIPVKLHRAGYQNLKITTPEDMQIARLYCGLDPLFD